MITKQKETKSTIAKFNYDEYTRPLGIISMKTNPWTFGIIFLAVSLYLMLNDFELPKFIPFENTDTVEAIIYKTRDSRSRLPHGGMDQNNFYVYQLNGENYISVFRSKRNNNAPMVGDSLLIKYSLSSPNKSELIKNYGNVLPNRTLSRKKTKPKNFKITENSEIIFIENIFLYKYWGEGKNESFKLSGTYKKDNKILNLNPLVFHKYNAGKYKSEELIAYNSDTISLNQIKINKNGTLSLIK